MIKIRIQLLEQICAAYHSTNPYQDHLQALLDCNVMPFRTVADFRAGKMCPRKMAKACVILALQVANLVRFAGVLLGSALEGLCATNYFAPFFTFQRNAAYFNATIFFLFVPPTILCK